MAYPNTTTQRYTDTDNGKIYDGVFVEQMRTEVTKENKVVDALVAEGKTKEEAEAIATILKLGNAL